MKIVAKTKMGRLRDDLQQWMKDVSERVEGHKNENAALSVVIADLTIQLEIHKQFLLRLGIPECDYEKLIDGGRGIRALAPTEQLSKGDMVWVSYAAKSDDDVLHQEENVPVRIGSEAAIFEEALIGKAVGDEVHHEAKYLGDGEAKGKMILFDVKILKAKTRLIPEAASVG